MQAFVPAVETARDSVVKLVLADKTIALGTVVDKSGLVVTKASEMKSGTLTCKLADGKEAEATLLGVDDVNDLALIRVAAAGLKPVQWAAEEASVGQWAVTPGIGSTPEAVGIVSVPTRKLHKRAFIGVVLDPNASQARIAEIMTGLGAEKAGLKPGDVILAANEQHPKNSEELMKVLRQFREGQTVKLRVQRGDDEFDASVSLMVPRSTPAPAGFRRPNRQERMNRMGGELSQRAEGFEFAIQHDTVLQPWQCGGPLVNLDGKAIGLNIARAGRAASYALPAALVKQIVEAWVSP